MGRIGAVAVAVAAILLLPLPSSLRKGTDIRLAPLSDDGAALLRGDALPAFIGEKARTFALIASRPGELRLECLGCSELDAARLVGAVQDRFPDLSGQARIAPLEEHHHTSVAAWLWTSLVPTPRCPCPACVRSIDVNGEQIPVERLRARAEVVAYRLVDENGHIANGDDPPASEQTAPYMPVPCRSVQAPSHGPPHPVLGDPAALVRVLVFSEFTCPRCVEFDQTLKDLVAAYGGAVSVEFRHRPQPGDAFAEAAARAAIAAQAQGQFWAMHDRLEKQARPLSRDELLAEAADIGLDVGRVAAVLDAPEAPSILREDLADADALDVSELPTAFVNGSRIEGTPALRALRRAVDLEMAYARVAPRSADDPEAQAFPFLVQGLVDLDTQPCRAAGALRRAVALAPPRSLVRDGAERQLALLDRVQ